MYDTNSLKYNIWMHHEDNSLDNNCISKHIIIFLIKIISNKYFNINNLKLIIKYQILIDIIWIKSKFNKNILHIDSIDMFFIAEEFNLNKEKFDKLIQIMDLKINI